HLGMRCTQPLVPAPAGGATGRVVRLLAVLGMFAVALLVWAPGATAAAAPLSVTITVDQPEVTVDLSPGATPVPVVLQYEVVVSNAGDDVVPGVVVRLVPPTGLHTEVAEMSAGDLGAGAAWRGSFE